MHVLHLKMSIRGTGCEVSIRIIGGPVYVHTGLCSLGISVENHLLGSDFSNINSIDCLIKP